ncbi:hypothetical protein D3C87_1730690 [compost metagenome]
MFIPRIKIQEHKVYYTIKPNTEPDKYWINPMIGNIIRYKQDGRTVYLQGEDENAIILRLGTYRDQILREHRMPAEYKEKLELFLSEGS